MKKWKIESRNVDVVKYWGVQRGHMSFFSCSFNFPVIILMKERANPIDCFPLLLSRGCRRMYPPVIC